MRKILWLCTCGMVFGTLVGLGVASAQTNRTWNGSLSTDWFNPGNWTPAGVPASNDTINFTNGTINLSAPVIINGQFNWSAGTLSGNGLTIASNGVMAINATTTMFLENPLTNSGVVTWTNNGGLDVLNDTGGHGGLIENLSGGLFDIQTDQGLFNNSGTTTAYFHNAGTLRKSANSGTTTFSIPLINSGSVTVLEGTLNFSGGGPLVGNYTAATGAAIHFSGGNFSNSAPTVISGPGSAQFTGGNLLLLADAIANLPLVGGTVNLGPAFQGGTITNLIIAGATLAGTNTVTGTFNWNNGTIAGGPLTVASNGVLRINGTTTLFLQSALTNAGTVIWTNNGYLDVQNNNSSGFAGLIVNLAGGLFDIQNDQNLANNEGTSAYFYNAGTLRKSASTGVTFFSFPLINPGSLNVLQGTLNFNGGGPLAGNYTAAAGAAIVFSGGNFSNSAPAVIAGSAQFTGGNLLLLTDAIANLPLLGGTVNLGPAFQGGTISNLTIAGATLAGTNTVTGTFNWNNGTIAGGPLTIASNGVMHISGSTTLLLQSALTNAGTVTWTNNGYLDVQNNNSSSYAGLIVNLTGGLFDIQTDQNLANNEGTSAYFYNAGTLQKSARTGTTSISIPVTNSGTIKALQGNLAFSGGFTPGGGTLFFGLSSAANYGSVSISGTASLSGTVGLLLLNGFVPASGSSFTLVNYGSYTGIFTNLSLPAAGIWVTNYGTTSFTMSVANINKLGFNAQPVGGKLTNVIIAPVVVQVEDPSNNPVAISGIGITLSLNSGSGILNGTLSQNTDPTGKATFGDLNFNAIGSKTLRAASAQLTAAISVPFQIVPLIGEQLSRAGLLLQLNGSNNAGATTISVSTNLITWVPIYTNAPTNGPIQFLDSAATNYRVRFYKIVEQ